MYLISIASTFAIIMIILNPQMIFGAYAPDEVEIQVTTDKLSYKHGDILTIKGSGAHSYTIFTEIIDPNGKVITNLMFIAGNNGDFSTAWIIPSELQEGKFIVHVWDISNEAKTIFYLGNIPHYQEISYEYIPEWVRSAFILYGEKHIGGNELIKALQYLIKEEIINVPKVIQTEDNMKLQIPSWFGKNVDWWLQRLLSDDEFFQGIQYLIKIGVIQLEQNIQNQTIQTIPASSGTVVNFYVNDDDLNINPNGVDIVFTSGLIEITINGVMIDVPKKMIETSPNSGKFFLKIELPVIINGKPLDQNDIFLIKYIDESDASGEKRTIVESFPLTKTFAKLQTYDGGNRIGHEFTLRLYEPDSNRDSRDEDKISLSALEFRSEGGIRTTLSNPAFDANSSFLIETGPNTGIFEVKIKIPRSIDGKTIHIGDWYEIRYIDRSTPSGTNEKIILKGKIGLQ